MLLGSSHIKHACKNIGKTDPSSQFKNILQAAFVTIFFRQKLQSQNVTGVKQHKTLWYEKDASKM